jgi:hypothetical protein
MTTNRERENLVRVKTALAAKYESLARISNSRPKQAKWQRLASKYRRQAARLGTGGA